MKINCKGVDFEIFLKSFNNSSNKKSVSFSSRKTKVIISKLHVRAVGWLMSSNIFIKLVGRIIEVFNSQKIYMLSFAIYNAAKAQLKNLEEKDKLMKQALDKIHEPTTLVEQTSDQTLMQQNVYKKNIRYTHLIDTIMNMFRAASGSYSKHKLPKSVEPLLREALEKSTSYSQLASFRDDETNFDFRFFVMFLNDKDREFLKNTFKIINAPNIESRNIKKIETVVLYFENKFHFDENEMN